MTEDQKVPVPQTEEEAEKQSKTIIIFRFILVPLVLVGIVVLIIVFFGNIALQEKSVGNYIYDMKTGSKSERWQAAYHLSNLLANPKKDNTTEAKKHLPELIQIFEKAKGEDPEIRRYLALTFGRLQDPRAVPALITALNDDDSQTVIWSLWALGSIGDRQATPAVLEKFESSDAGIRAMCAYVLGAVQDPAAIPALQGHLDDSSSEVSWNSAIGLARMGNSSGSDVLQKMMDRNYLAGFPTMSETNKEELLINAILASTKLSDPELKATIQKLSTSDPNLRVRNTAIKALGK